MDANYEAIRREAHDAMAELLERANLRPGALVERNHGQQHR